jgi:hypothetical protein
MFVPDDLKACFLQAGWYQIIKLPEKDLPLFPATLFTEPVKIHTDKEGNLIICYYTCLAKLLERTQEKIKRPQFDRNDRGIVVPETLFTPGEVREILKERNRMGKQPCSLPDAMIETLCDRINEMFLKICRINLFFADYPVINIIYVFW